MSSLGDTQQARPNNTLKWWPNVAITLAVFFLWLVLFFDEVSASVNIWMTSDTYAHGFFIGPIVIWLFWRRKQEYLSIKARPSYWAALACITLVGLWFFAQLVEINSLVHLFTFALLSNLLWLVFGDEFARRFKFGLVYLLFSAPFGNVLIPYLQTVTAKITVYFLQLSDIPVFFEGLYITIPSGVFEVAVACSGIRYLIACFAIGSLYAHLSYKSAKRKAVFIAFSIIFPIFANGIRAYLIVIIAHLSDMKYATGFDHLIYGWVFFGLVIYLMFFIGNRWADKEQDAPVSTTASGVVVVAKSRYGVVVICLAILALVVVRYKLIEDVMVPSSPVKLNAGQLALGQVPAHLNWGVAFNDSLSAFSGIDGAGVEVFMAKFAHKQSRGKLITSTNQFFKPSYWSLLSSQQRTMNIDGHKLVFRQLLLTSTYGHRRIVRYWYTLDGFYYDNPWQIKARQGIALLINSSEFAYVNAISRVFVNESSEENNANEILDLWMQQQAIPLRQVLK